MMDMEKLERELAELPLLMYDILEPEELEFSCRIRWICQHDCPMYGSSWACPPGVGTVEECKARCLGYDRGLLIATAVEVADISDVEETLATRRDHEVITDEVRAVLRRQGKEPYVLSTESCALCKRCAFLDGEPCRLPERMHPCVESHGINIIPALEKRGLAFQYGCNVVTWVSLLLFSE